MIRCLEKNLLLFRVEQTPKKHPSKNTYNVVKTIFNL